MTDRGGGTIGPRRDKDGRGGGERPMVPAAEFRSYYGRPVIKKPVWKWDVPAYFATGGLMAASSLLAGGADLTGNRRLRRTGRIAAAVNLGMSTYFLIHDLGRPGRFYNMLRVVKPTSPMNVGTWILAAYGAPVAAAAASEMTGLAPRAGRVAGLAASAIAPAVASYTAVVASDTAVPAWHDAYPHLPFVFVGSAMAAGGGLAVASVPPLQAGPARRMALLGAALDLGSATVMERKMGLSAEPYHEGTAGRLNRGARLCTTIGAIGAGLLGRRSRAAAVASGAALLAGSALTRFAVFHAGLQSAADPKYTVVPQRRRVDAGRPVRAAPEAR